MVEDNQELRITGEVTFNLLEETGVETDRVELVKKEE